MKLERPYALTFTPTGGDTVPVIDSDQVVPALTSLHRAGVPLIVSLYRYLVPGSTSIADAAGCLIGLGAPRSTLLSLAHGLAADPTLPLLTEELIFSFGGEPTPHFPPETRLTPEKAFQLAAELILEPVTPPASVEWIR